LRYPVSRLAVTASGDDCNETPSVSKRCRDNRKPRGAEVARLETIASFDCLKKMIVIVHQKRLLARSEDLLTASSVAK
jgi:hypothetical protein